MTVKISKPAINLREELASLRNQGGLPKEDKLYLEIIENDSGEFNKADGTDIYATYTAWSNVYNSTFVVQNNKGRFSPAGGFPAANLTLSGFTKGRTYTITAEAQASVNSKTIDIDVNGQVATITSNGSVQTIKNVFVSDGNTESFQFRFDSNNGYVDFDNISVQEVGENLVTNGTFDSDLTGWTVVNPNGQTVEQTGGKLRLATTVGSDYVDANQLLTNTTSGKTYTLSLDYTKTSGNGFSLVINGVQTNHTASGHIVRTFVSDGSDFIQIKRLDVSDNLFDNVTVTEGNHEVIQSIPYGYDVKDVYIDGELAREGEAYDYQVQTDGINQWLKPTVEPTATTETVVIGVRK